MIYVTRSFNFWFLLVLFSVLQQKNLQVLSPFVFFPVLLRMRRYTFPPISLNLFPKIIQRHNFRITFLKISIWSTFPKRIFKKPPLYFGFINSFRGGIQTYAFFFLFDFAWGNHFFIAGLFAKSINSCFVRIEGGGRFLQWWINVIVRLEILIAFFRPPPAAVWKHYIRPKAGFAAVTLPSIYPFDRSDIGPDDQHTVCSGKFIEYSEYNSCLCNWKSPICRTLRGFVRKDQSCFCVNPLSLPTNQFRSFCHTQVH